VPLFGGDTTSTWVERRSVHLDGRGLVEIHVRQETPSCGLVSWGNNETERACWPRILVAGAHKSATTAVWTMLAKHPGIVAGEKENNLACELKDETWLAYVRKVGARLARSSTVASMTLEATPSITYCGTSTMGLTERLRVVDRLLRPSGVVFLHRDPVDRAWSEYRFFSAFNRKKCGIPTAAGFRTSVRDQIANLTSTCPSGNGCAAEMKLQLLKVLPYLPCHRITRIVLGFSHYFQAKYEAVFGTDRILAVDFNDARLPETANRVFRFLGLDPVAVVPSGSHHKGGGIPVVRPEDDAFNRRFNFSFPGDEKNDPDRVSAFADLAEFYATFDPHVLDSFVDFAVRY